MNKSDDNDLSPGNFQSFLNFLQLYLHTSSGPIRPTRIPSYLPSNNFICCNLAAQVLQKANFFPTLDHEINMYHLVLLRYLISFFKTKHCLFISRFREHRVQCEEKVYVCLYWCFLLLCFLASFSSFVWATSCPALHWWNSSVSRGVFLPDQKHFIYFFQRIFQDFCQKKMLFSSSTLYSLQIEIYIYFFRLLVPKSLKLSKGASKMGSSIKVADLNPARAPLQTAPAIEEKPCACTTWSSRFPMCFRGAGW